MDPKLVTPLVLAVALFMENIDATVIATSLVTIAADLDASPIALKLAMTSYLVSLAVFIPVSSWMADRFGARRLLRGAMIVFMLGSVWCALADSLVAFVLARFMQGMGGAMMTPIARLIIVRVTPRTDLVRAMSWLSIPGLIGPLLGPPLGGFITTYAGWHWIFLINVPIGLMGIVLAGRFLPDWPASPPPPLDYAGLIYGGISFGGLTFGLSILTLPALPEALGWGAVIAGTVSGCLYFIHFRRAPEPILDLRLFTRRLFRMAIVGGTVFRLGAGAMPFLLPLMLQMVFRLNPFESGLVLLSTAIGALSAKFTAGPVIRHFGFRLSLAGSTAIASLSFAALTLFSSETQTFVLMALLCVLGFFQSTFWTAINAFTFADIDEPEAGQASMISQVAIQLSLAFGVAIGGSLLEFAAPASGELSMAQFRMAFIVLALLGLGSAALFLLIPKGSGADMAGR